MSNIKNVIFDLGGVILKGQAAGVLTELNIDEKERNELSRFFDNWEALDRGEMTLEEKYDECNFKDDKYKDFLINYYKVRDNNDDVIRLINKLKSNGYNIYVLSDSNKEVADHVKKLDVLKNIDGFVISCDYHALKQDGILFEILLNNYNLNSDECYLIDDLVENINTAKKYNIDGYVFDENDDISKLYEIFSIKKEQ